MQPAEVDRDSGDPSARWGGRPPFQGLPPAVRLWLPVVLSFLVQVPATLVILWRFAPAETPAVATAAVAAAAAGPLALIAARRFPGPVASVVTVAAVADLLLAPLFGPPYLAFAFAVALGIVRGARVWVYASVAVGWVAAITIGSLLDIDWHPVRIALATAGIALLLALAERVRQRRERFREARRTATERRLTVEQAERMRIARELHDVLAHSLSQINVQAGVGLHLMDSQPERARESLVNIKSASKTALDEVRGVLAFLRADAADAAALAPQPDLSRIPGLLGSVRAQGLEIGYTSSIHTPPTAGVQLALYRIVQESLTNVLRHAHARSADVRLDDEAGSIRLTISDDGRGRTEPSANPAGSGILGMGERAELLGGTLIAANGKDGGFVVTATFPVTT
ncbi:signal transduction histidine kinase [Mycetocola sp. CAN_C7]|uniref:sensor histidine kinase n=1 Tax=Mycetocola sp. CAN_C7 TaxID=2787724 RepID=UPI0018CA1D5E